MGMSWNAATGQYEFHDQPGFSGNYNQQVQSNTAAANKANEGTTYNQTSPWSGERSGGAIQKSEQAATKALQSAGPTASAAPVAPQATPEESSSSTSKSSTTTTTTGGGMVGGGTVPDKPETETALGGLTGALGELSSGGGGATAVTGANSTVGYSGSGLRAGLGTRAYPQDMAALAQLRKVY